MVFAAGEGLLFVAVGSGEVDFGSSVGGYENVPLEAVAITFPAAFD